MAIDPFTLGVGGAAVGGVLGGIGGGIQGAAQSRSAKRDRRRTRKGIAQGQALTDVQVSAYLNSPEFRAARQFILGTFGQEATPLPGQDLPAGSVSSLIAAGAIGRNTTGIRSAGLASGSEAAERLLNFSGVSGGRIEGRLGTGFASRIAGASRAAARQRATDFDTVSTELEAQAADGFGLNSPLARDFRTSINQALASRGLEGVAPAVAEAGGLAAFNFQQQQQMLPQLLALAEQPQNIRNQFDQFNIAREVYRTTGGTTVYGQANPNAVHQGGAFVGALQGALGGAAGGFNFGFSAGNALQQDEQRRLRLHQQAGGF